MDAAKTASLPMSGPMLKREASQGGRQEVRGRGRREIRKEGRP